MEAIASNVRHAEPYQHSALENPRHSIRLCKLVSEGLRSRSHTIELEIEHYILDNVNDYDFMDEGGFVEANFGDEQLVVSLTDDNGHRERAKYTAISYCWGEKVASHTIGLNGCDFAVSENLYHLLGVLRDGDENRKLLWIDQLCINQLDTSERNNQVSLMNYIYSSAEAVYVWLGNATPETSSGLRMLDQLESRGISSEQMSEGHVKEDDGYVLANEEATGLRAARDLLTREFWTRLWIVQEVIYARRLFFLCGPHKYQFGKTGKDIDMPTYEVWISRAVEENIISGAIFNKDESHVSGAFDASYVLRETLSLLQHYLFMQECRRNQYSGYILSFDAVASHGWRQCRDPRDKIFGLQSLVSPSRRVDINYEKSPKEIFEEWFESVDPRKRHIPLDPEYVRPKIRTLYAAMGLGDISQQHLDELVEYPKPEKQTGNRDEIVSKSSHPGNLSSGQAWLYEKRWHILFSTTAVICAYWLFTKRLRGGLRWP